MRSSRPVVIPRCRLQTAGWFCRTASRYGQLVSVKRSRAARRLLARREAEGDQGVLHRRRRAASARLGRELAADVPAGALDRREVSAPRGAREPAAQLEIGLRRPARGLGVARDRPSSRGRPRCWRVTCRSRSPASARRRSWIRTVLGWRSTRAASSWVVAGRRSSPSDVEQPRAKRVGEGVVSRTWRELPSRSSFLFPFRQGKHSPCGSHATRGGSGADVREAALAGVQGLGPGGPAGGPVRLLRARAAGLPDLHGQAADAAARRRSLGADALHGGGHPQGPAGLPPQRAHGVRLGLRPRRVPGPGLHGRLPAPRLGLRDRQERRRRLRQRGAPDDRRVPHQPLRQAHRHADAHRLAGRGATGGWSGTTRASSPTRRRSTGCGRTRSPTATSCGS